MNINRGHRKNHNAVIRHYRRRFFAIVAAIGFSAAVLAQSAGIVLQQRALASPTTHSAGYDWSEVTLGAGLVDNGEYYGYDNWQEISSSHDGTILAAIDYYSVYISTDSGMSWHPQYLTASGMKPKDFNQEFVSVSSDGSAIAVYGTYSGNQYIFLSEDNGHTWVGNTMVTSCEFGLRSIMLNANGTALLAANYCGGVVRSTDGGQTWTPLPTLPDDSEINSMSASVDESVIVLSSFRTCYVAPDYTDYIPCGSMYISHDTGQTWTETIPPERGSTFVSSDGMRMFITGDEATYAISEDSGATWQSGTVDGLSYISPSSFAMSGNGTTLLAAGGYEEPVYVSTNFGQSWTEMDIRLASSYWGVVSLDFTGNKMVVSNDFTVYISDDAGQTWRNLGSSGIGDWLVVGSSTDGSILVAGREGALFMSEDHGATWSDRTPTDGYGGWWGSAALSADGHRVIAYADGMLAVSSDTGHTWEVKEIDGDMYDSTVASSADGRVLVAAASWFNLSAPDGSEAPLYVSHDYGATWVKSIQVQDWECDWASVVISADGQKIVAGSHCGFIYISNDSGSTWTHVINLGSYDPEYDDSYAMWHTIAMTPDGQTIFAADTCGEDCDNGFGYLSHDGGVTWHVVDNLAPWWWSDWLFHGAAISSDGQAIAISTQYDETGNWRNGGTIFISRDGGETWASTKEEFPNREFSSVAMSSDGSQIIVSDWDYGFIYIGTHEGANGDPDNGDDNNTPPPSGNEDTSGDGTTTTKTPPVAPSARTVATLAPATDQVAQTTEEDEVVAPVTGTGTSGTGSSTKDNSGETPGAPEAGVPWWIKDGVFMFWLLAIITALVATIIWASIARARQKKHKQNT